MRIITDELFAKLVKVLAEDEKIKVYQELLLSQKAEATENKEEIKTSEVKK